MRSGLKENCINRNKNLASEITNDNEGVEKLFDGNKEKVWIHREQATGYNSYQSNTDQGFQVQPELLKQLVNVAKSMTIVICRKNVIRRGVNNVLTHYKRMWDKRSVSVADNFYHWK